jgi:hypothetical protein
MDVRLKKLLTKEKSKNDVNLDSQTLLSIDNTSRPLPLNNIKEVLNVAQLSDEERQASSKYRFYGNIRPVVSNALYNKNVKIYNSGSTTIPGVVAVTSDEIVESNGWFGYYDDDKDTAQSYEQSAENFNDNQSSLCQFIPFDPGYNRLNFIDPDGVPNYRLKMTYPAYTTDLELVTNGGSSVSLSDGLPVVNLTGITINDREYTILETAIQHGLTDDDEIKLYNFTDNTGNDLGLNDRLFKVFKLGDQKNDNKERVVVLDINPNEISLNLGASSITRWVDDIESTYYVRVFSALTNEELEYDIYPTGYETNYYDDGVASYNFKNDIDIDGIKDNLGRPLSEVFLTIIKKSGDTTTQTLNDIYWETESGISNFWTQKTGGFITTKNENINYNIRAYNDSNFNQLYFSGITEDDTQFIGDIVEYNENELYEKVLEDFYQRINTSYREVTDQLEGYIYKPHYRAKIRDYSSYIEYGDPKKVVNIPDYAILTYSGTTSASTQVYKWRDLLDIGVYDQAGAGVDYPFLSGAHYLYISNRYYFQRQDPPCDVELTDIEVNINGVSSYDEIIEGLTSPNFMGIVSVEINSTYPEDDENFVYDGTQDLTVVYRTAEYFGEYDLGKRGVAGGCVELTSIETKNIDNVC